MVVTNDLFLRFAKDGRAIKNIKANQLKHLAQESFRLALCVTVPIKDITIKSREAPSSAYSRLEFDIGDNRYVLEKDMNYVILTMYPSNTARYHRLLCRHIDTFKIVEVGV